MGGHRRRPVLSHRAGQDEFGAGVDSSWELGGHRERLPGGRWGQSQQEGPPRVDCELGSWGPPSTGRWVGRCPEAMSGVDATDNGASWRLGVRAQLTRARGLGCGAPCQAQVAGRAGPEGQDVTFWGKAQQQEVDGRGGIHASPARPGEPMRAGEGSPGKEPQQQALLPPTQGPRVAGEWPVAGPQWCPHLRPVSGELCVPGSAGDTRGPVCPGRAPAGEPSSPGLGARAALQADLVAVIWD